MSISNHAHSKLFVSPHFLYSLYFCTLRPTYCSRTCGRRCRFIIIIIKVSMVGNDLKCRFRGRLLDDWNRLHTCKSKLLTSGSGVQLQEKIVKKFLLLKPQAHCRVHRVHQNQILDYYLQCAQFKSRQWCRLSWLMILLPYSVPPGKCRVITLN
jgi:hypothetical protein